MHRRVASPPRHDMRRGNRVVKPRSAPGAEMGPSTSRFAPLLSPEISPGEPLARCRHVTACFWKAGTGPGSSGRGSAVGPGVAQQERELSCLPVPVVTWHSVGPSLCWGTETQGKRLRTQARERSRELWLPWKRERSSKGTDRWAMEGRSYTH